MLERRPAGTRADPSASHEPLRPTVTPPAWHLCPVPKDTCLPPPPRAEHQPLEAPVRQDLVLPCRGGCGVCVSEAAPGPLRRKDAPSTSASPGPPAAPSRPHTRPQQEAQAPGRPAIPSWVLGSGNLPGRVRRESAGQPLKSGGRGSAGGQTSPSPWQHKHPPFFLGLGSRRQQERNSVQARRAPLATPPPPGQNGRPGTPRQAHWRPLSRARSASETSSRTPLKEQHRRHNSHARKHTARSHCERFVAPTSATGVGGAGLGWLSRAQQGRRQGKGHPQQPFRSRGFGERLF